MNDGLRACCIQWLPTPGAFDDNLEQGLALIDQAVELGVDLIVLPELWISGYDTARLATDIADSAEALSGGRMDEIARRAQRHGVWIVAGSIAETTPTGIANTAPVYDRHGELRAVHRKHHLYPFTGEDVIFVPGDGVTTFEDDELGRVGINVCFDGDFPATVRSLSEAGVELVLQPNAYELEAAAYWDAWYPAQAMATGQFWVMTNQCGVNPSGTILGASKIIDPSGAILAEGPRSDGMVTPEASLVVAPLKITEAVIEARHFAALLE